MELPRTGYRPVRPGTTSGPPGAGPRARPLRYAPENGRPSPRALPGLRSCLRRLREIQIARAFELPADLAPLLEASLAEGFRFLERLRGDWSSGANRFAEPGEAFFAARHRGSLAGVCGLNRDPYATDPAVGRLRHLYVAPSMRRQGVARALVRQLLACANPYFSVVRVRTDTREADLFYLALGFSRSLSSGDATHELRMRKAVVASGS